MIHIVDALSGDSPAYSMRDVESILLDRYFGTPSRSGTVTVRCLEELKFLVKRGS